MSIGCIALLFLSCRISDQDSAEIVADSGLDYVHSEISLSQEVVWRSVEPAYATGGELVDINGDGLLDFVVSEGNDMEPGYIRVYHHNGEMLESEASFVSSKAQFYGHVSTGDLNGDGWSDIVVSKFLGTERFDEPGGVEVYLNEEGSLPLTPSWSWDGAYTFSLTLGDMEQDGDIDIAVAVGEAYFNEPDVSFILCNDGSGSFFRCWEDSLPRYSFDVSFCDLNRDGWQDIIFAHQGEGHTIRWGNAEGFSELPDWQAQGDGFEGNTLDWGDINGDEILDIVVSDNNQLGGSGTVRAWCGPDFWLCWESQDDKMMQSAILLRDFDGDGDTDLAASSWWGALRIYEQTEEGLSLEPVFVGNESEIVAEAFSWGAMQKVEKEIFVGSGMIEIPQRRTIASIQKGVFAGGYLFGEEIEAQIYVLDKMGLVLTDWEKYQGNWMFVPEPME
ncbi:MAG: hypothetical protein CL916_01035 [Deltaproteobacteria bacterium]|nr:hypothetical protein [Deltaproteobacteria bacterium]